MEVSNGAGGEGGTKLGREFQIVYMPTRAEEVVAAEVKDYVVQYVEYR